MELNVTSTTPRVTVMVIDARDLAARLALAKPSDAAKGMFFNGALSAIKTLAGDAAADRCRQISGEKKFIDFFNYPITGFLKLTYTAAEILAPKLGGYEAVFRALGKQAVDDYLATTVGKTLLAIAGKNPKRLLYTVPSAFKAAVTYGERKVEFRGDSGCLFSMRGDFMPHPYHEGVLKTVLEALTGAETSVVGTRLGVVDADYEITWKNAAKE
jgi:uncharacterized protein (TIGR02265 family)